MRCAHSTHTTGPLLLPYSGVPSVPAAAAPSRAFGVCPRLRAPGGEGVGERADAAVGIPLRFSLVFGERRTCRALSAVSQRVVLCAVVTASAGAFPGAALDCFVVSFVGGSLGRYRPPLLMCCP